jgi:hypothetical protein
VPLSHEDLRADDINAGNDLGNRVLDLHARIHFDEVESAGIDIEQKFDRSGAEVIGRTSDLDRGFTQFFANPGVKIDGGSHLHHFLMTSLNGAITLVQVEDIPVLISQNLHFDVLCAANKALEKNRIISERRRGFLSGFCNLGLEFTFVFNDAHSAPSSPKGGFYDQRETDLLRNVAGNFCVCHWFFGAWNHGHTGPLCQTPGSRLIAQ